MPKNEIPVKRELLDGEWVWYLGCAFCNMRQEVPESVLDKYDDPVLGNAEGFFGLLIMNGSWYVKDGQGCCPTCHNKLRAQLRKEGKLPPLRN